MSHKPPRRRVKAKLREDRTEVRAIASTNTLIKTHWHLLSHNLFLGMFLSIFNKN